MYGVTHGVDCFTDMFSALYGFMRSGEFTDITFIVGGTKIKAHKAVLASCSSVFRSMFESRMVEFLSNEVKIEDVDAEPFKAFIEYIYHRDTSDIGTHAKSMLYLAEKYHIEPLLRVCDDAIGKLLTLQNAVDYFILADLCNRDNLKSEVGAFITKHVENIISGYKDEWSKLKSFPLLQDEIIMTLSDGGDPNPRQSYLDEITWIVNEESNIDGNDKSNYYITSPGREKRLEAQVSLGRWTPLKSNGVFFKLSHDVKEGIPLKITITRKEGATAMFTSVYYTLAKAHDNTEYFFNIQELQQEDSTPKLTCPYKVSMTVEEARLNLIYPYISTLKKPKYFYDATIILDDGKVTVHKVILATRSEFFADVLKEDTKEFKIEGMKEDTFKLLVDYMYLECYPPPKKVDIPLLNGACKFKLQHLINHCQTVLSKNMTPQNIFNARDIADKSCLNEIKSSMLKCMKDNLEKVLDSVISLK